MQNGQRTPATQLAEMEVPSGFQALCSPFYCREEIWESRNKTQAGPEITIHRLCFVVWSGKNSGRSRMRPQRQLAIPGATLLVCCRQSALRICDQPPSPRVGGLQASELSVGFSNSKKAIRTRSCKLSGTNPTLDNNISVF